MKNLIPKPVSVNLLDGTFKLNSKNRILVESSNNQVLSIGEYLAEKLNAKTGFAIPVETNDGENQNGRIILKTGADGKNLGGEGYHLVINSSVVEITAPNPVGIFYGVITLLQLLPITNGPWKIACCSIIDYPRYSWRGTMLDVSRHFFGVEDLKHYIDLLANYKLNVLHLHLSDDQGWRIEIRSWPNLTKIGGSTAINGDPGGFYTQEQYAEIVAYAQSRYITIIPEIDLPGHTHAALASYPELNCDGKALELYTGGEVGHSSLCIEKQITYQFVDDIMRELAAITPGPYIHIGGDEAHSTPKDAYKQFIERVEGIVKSHGKEIICWEEAAQCNLSPASVLQYWKDNKFAEMAVEKGMQIIMSPAPRIYLDMKYQEDTKLGLTWAGISDTQNAYTWDPLTEVKGLAESTVLGVEAPLWSETLVSMADIEYMAFPRLIGVAEIGWSPADGRGWDEYSKRLSVHGKRLASQGLNFFRDPCVIWE